MSRQQQLDAIAREIRVCTLCRLSQSRTHAVPGEGSPHAAIFCIGEAPGENEDVTGRPFQGRSGREFTRLLGLAGLKREGVFVTGINKCRPPGNRRPRRDEMEICRRAHLDRQLAVIKPRLVVLMGGVAVEEMLGMRGPLRDVIGRSVERDGRRYLVTYHPSAAMRFPAIKRAAERHFRRLRRLVGG
jgi:uracil-DNA glycosylase family 4